MKPLFSLDELKNSKPNQKLPCKCLHCNKTFYALPKEIRKALNGHRAVKIKYCSRACAYKSKITKVKVKCKECKTDFYKDLNQFKKIEKGSKRHFCSKSCSATYNNKHKTHGSKRSKFEIYLEKHLTSLYPNIKFDFNKKDTINSELDIYIPSLKIAFELNGIFHYKPIYGQKKLKQTQNNDKKKLKKCNEMGILFYAINISNMTHFKPEKSKSFVNTIVNIINNSM